MATNPLTYGPDGILRETVEFSTTVLTRFFQGTVPEEAVDVQVSINGSGFSGDATLVQWGDGEWIVPNPSFEPDGLLLLEGENTVEIRAVLPSGSVTPATSSVVRLITDSDLGIVSSAPTNVSLEQRDKSVTIRAEAPDDPAGAFRGINVYASQFAGGGATGYQRVNVNLVSDGVSDQDVQQFAMQMAEFPLAVDVNGDPIADPTLFRLIGRQEDSDAVILQSDFDQSYEVPDTARTIRLSMTLDEVRDITLYEFNHNRKAGPTSTPATIRVASFTNLSSDVPLYYVTTAVFYDAVRMVEYESAFSVEVVGRPNQVTTALAAIPTVSRQDIVRQFITAIFRSNPQVKVEPGSMLRDTVIDPFSSESERLRFILDFYHRARTPTLLLQVDDPSGSGTSIPVSQSAYKQGLKVALYIDNDTEVQSLIDAAFEAYARNFNVTRRTGAASRTEVLFFTPQRPSASLVIPLGTTVAAGGVAFTTTREATIATADVARYFNPITGSYQITVPVQATTTGSNTNVGVGQIRQVVSSLATTLRVTNLAAAVGGQDAESNLSLVNRALNRLASVDSGTERGYLQTAADVPGVLRANVVSAGDPLMQRDLDDVGEHKGGKVDVWVQGQNTATITDTFAFTFQIAQDIQFEVIGDPAELRFRAVDPTLTEANPIVEMLDNPSLGYEFINASTDQPFDLTDVQITSYNTIQLSTAVVQPAVDLTDVILGSYRRRTGVEFPLPRQPVSGITSVVGTLSGTLPEDAYLLIRPNAPLDTGRSILAGDTLRIDGFVNDDGIRIPTGGAITVTDEPHVLVGQYPEFVDNLGANFLTVVVKSEDGVTTYAGPGDPGGNPDYQITVGSQTDPLSITRTPASTIPSGATVLVSYQHDENFTVTYTTNLIVSLTQDAIDAKKHATADVLAKEAVEVPLDIQATVILIRGRDPGVVDTAVRTNLANFFTNLRLGEPVRQSDVINVIEQTQGVSYVIVPVTKMVRQAGSTVVREPLSTDTAAESTLLSSLSTNTILVYVLNQTLAAATVDGGGGEEDFKGVFQDERALDLFAPEIPLANLGYTVGAAYIIGSDGRQIPGYSDDATLIAEGYVTASAREARRKALTANKALVSLAVGDAPTAHEYAVTYIVGEDSGAKNIDPSDAEFCSPGEFTFTYDEDR